MRSAARTALACWICAWACAARAQTEAQPPVVDLGPKEARPGLLDRPIGITLSGGVSLGSYEAGYLYYVVEELRALGVRPKVLTGTSAGSINAFVGLIESCRPASRLPTDSLLYRTWIPMGLDELFIPGDVTADAVLSRKGFDRAVREVRAAWDHGLLEGCDVRLGTSVTRSTPRLIKISDGDATIPRMTERFFVRVRGLGLGHEPQIENARTREIGRMLALLPLDGAGTHPFDAVVDMLQASSGVPLAFPVKKLLHCTPLPKDDEVPACRLDQAHESNFIDGALFDNRPLGLAYSALKELAGGQHPALLFIDPNLRTWPKPEVDTSTKSSGILALVEKELFDFVDTAMAAELERLIEREPELQRDLLVGQVHYPPASEPMGAFFGFVERELRRFDFYLGMYNARRFVAVERGVSPAKLADDGTRNGTADDPAWRPLRCLRALWDGDGDPAQRCAGDDLIDFRILAQLAGERVVNDCRHSAPHAESDHPMCELARAGKGAPYVPGVREHGDASIHADERGYEWVMRRLGELGFEFRDLGLKRSQASRGLLVLRAKLGAIVDALARKQGASALGYQLLGTYGLNQVKYLPPRHLFHLVVGDRVEAGWSFTAPTSPLRWARFSINLGLRGLDTIFSSRPIYFGLAPTAGLVLEPLFLSRPSVQTMLGFHAGYLFSTGDNLLAAHCDVTKPEVPCSRPLAEAVLSVAILGTLRVQLAATWLPAIRAGEKQGWSIGPAFGLQIPVGHLTSPHLRKHE